MKGQVDEPYFVWWTENSATRYRLIKNKNE